jgi:AraC family transcriptional regulator
VAEEYAGRLHGRVSRRGLDLAETSYWPYQSVARHAHDRPMLIVILAGRMTEHVRRRDVTCGSGTALFHPVGEGHAHTFGGASSRCLSLQIGDEWLERLGLDAATLPPGPVARLDPSVTGIGRLLHAEVRREEHASDATLDGLALALLGALAGRRESASNRRPRFLDIVVERIHDDVRADVQLRSLADFAGVTPEHLARTFRHAEGMTVGEYVRRLRVDRARGELERGRISLSRLALELGFYDQAHFTRTFKAHVGCTPGAYRRRHGPRSN